ncbi:hypothetical protein [Daejeonia sp. YH14]|uniref:hypothetical protein n=1 Tax=Daejeonia sp. YH14 TaxID=3439042 RepID=UPI003F499302
MAILCLTIFIVYGQAQLFDPGTAVTLTGDATIFIGSTEKKSASPKGNIYIADGSLISGKENIQHANIVSTSTLYRKNKRKYTLKRKVTVEVKKKNLTHTAAFYTVVQRSRDYFSSSDKENAKAVSNNYRHNRFSLLIALLVFMIPVSVSVTYCLHKGIDYREKYLLCSYSIRPPPVCMI